MAKDVAVLQAAAIPAATEKRARELDQAVTQAKRLLAKHFDAISNIQSMPTRDAETAESYVEVSFEVRGEVKDVRIAYDAFTDEWVKAYPGEVREQIRFVFAVI